MHTHYEKAGEKTAQVVSKTKQYSRGNYRGRGTPSACVLSAKAEATRDMFITLPGSGPAQLTGYLSQSQI